MDSFYERVISPQNNTEGFATFSLPHIAVILLDIIIITHFFTNRDKIRTNHKLRNKIMGTFAVLLVFAQCVFYVWNIIFIPDQWAKQLIPLHICTVALFPLVIFALHQNKVCYELLVVWGIIGGIPGVLIPSTLGYNFPHIVVFQTLLYHSVVLLSAFFISINYTYILNRTSYIRVILETFALAVISIITNNLVGSNYMFLGTSPEGQSTPIDLLPPGPVRVVGLMILFLIVVFIIQTVHNKLKSTDFSKHVDTGETA
jgi:hypothetical integral membrane protein (TIGR02206 family)